MDIANADVDAARKAIERHRDVIVGVKARLTDTVVGKNDLEAVRRARAAVEPFGLPVMLHVGQTVSPLPAILALLKPGDIVTHIYAPPPNSIFNARGEIFPGGAGGAEARHLVRHRQRPHRRTSRGRWPKTRIKRNFLPDTISSDWTDAGRASQVVDFPNVLSKFLMLGVPLDRVLAAGTSNAAKLFPAFKGLGTLARWRPRGRDGARDAPGPVRVRGQRRNQAHGQPAAGGQRHDLRAASGRRRRPRMSASVRGRCDAIEECYEFMLAYAAQGVSGEPGQAERRTAAHAPDGGRSEALDGLADAFRAAVAAAQVTPAEPYEAFIAVLDRDAADSLAAVRLVLAQPAISSQLVDNLNASIHLRALLTDLFLIDEVLASHLRSAQAP